MSSKDLLSSYNNIFNDINQQMSYARLELCCKYRKVTVNFSHDLRVTPDKTIDSDILKKNINTPQFDRLKRSPKTRAEEAKAENKKQQNTAANANIESEKALTDTQKATLETEEAKNYA